MRTDFMFTSESVTEGHPDKLCDRISDAIVDHCLQQDPYSEVIAECAMATGVVFIATRLSSNAMIDLAEIARSEIRQCGYHHGNFNASDCTILTNISELPSSVLHAIDERTLDDEELDRLVVRDQATVFGFACNQTTALMPLPIWLAHKLSRRLTSARLKKELSYLSPDGKSQVGIEYKDRRPSRVHSITLLASQAKTQTPDIETLRSDLMDQVILPVFENESIKPDDKTKIYLNPEGPIHTGGPMLHAGLTGRKTAIDTYGQYARHCSASLSGKDPLRIDRVGAYAARHAAKNIVAAGLAEECEVQLSYTIGQAGPVSIQVETFGTGIVDEHEITRRLTEHYDFRLGAILRRFNLRHQPAQVKGGFFRKLAAYGQVGRMDLGLPWETTEQAGLLRQK